MRKFFVIFFCFNLAAGYLVHNEPIEPQEEISSPDSNYVLLNFYFPKPDAFKLLREAGYQWVKEKMLREVFDKLTGNTYWVAEGNNVKLPNGKVVLRCVVTCYGPHQYVFFKLEKSLLYYVSYGRCSFSATKNNDTSLNRTIECILDQRAMSYQALSIPEKQFCAIAAGKKGLCMHQILKP